MTSFAIRPEGLVLEGHLVVPDGEPRALVYLLHGIPSGNPPDPSDAGYPGFARTMAARGFAAAHFDFRGARGAPGDFSLSGWHADLEAALDAAPLPDLPRIIVGSSAGGSVGIVVAARRPDVAAIATLAAPAEWKRLGNDLPAAIGRFRNSGIIHDPAFPADVDAWWDEFEQGSPHLHVARIAPRPLLVMHGDNDDVVPYTHAEQLFAEAGDRKEILRVRGAGHQLRRDPRALDALFDWLDRSGF